MTRIVAKPRHGRRRWQSKGQRHRAFLEALRATGCAAFAAAIVDVDRTTPYVWRARVPGFAAAWDAALVTPPARRRGLLDLPVARMNERLLIYVDRRLNARRRGGTPLFFDGP
ncbi:MAG: hypothetical protein K2Y40_16325 [Reyranella sp.]|nr:hypothetical protein [Reyranella sp.]